MFRGDSLLKYLNQVIFGPGRFKLRWKDWIGTYDIHIDFDRSRSLMRLWRIGRPRRMKAVPGFVLDSVRKIVENEVPVPAVCEAFGKSSRGTRRTNQVAGLISASSRYARNAASSLAVREAMLVSPFFLVFPWFCSPFTRIDHHYHPLSFTPSISHPLSFTPYISSFIHHIHHYHGKLETFYER
ncbi:hypothetical protein L1987_33349 [Smallanthus sonchifolius]|uniref:Uncharacterized protein n=1 Tax=Smallanthus sonchifolius TaxID=185202 RepID=A0ACB9HSG9_9ASTR|nr:hypothetical protein L1987_33349 [Smallanthus sonchifolius]